MFFSEYSYRPHLAENGGFQIRSPGWRFLKTEIYHIPVDGQKRRFSNTMTSCLGSRLALPHIRFENAACGRRFFEHGGNEVTFSKTPGYVWTVRYDSKTLRVDADFFKLKKLFVFENTRLRGNHARRNKRGGRLLVSYSLRIAGFSSSVFFLWLSIVAKYVVPNFDYM